MCVVCLCMECVCACTYVLDIRETNEMDNSVDSDTTTDGRYMYTL